MTRRSKARIRQRGAISVFFALVLITVIGGFIAMVVDVGHLWEVRGELQNAADSAALAGVRDLDGASAQFSLARSAAQTYARAHSADGTAVSVPSSDVVLGKWDFTARTFTPLTSPATAVNAVQVTTRRTAATGNAVATYFAPLLGITQEDVTAVAVGVGGGPSSTCGFVLAVPSCSIVDASGNLSCNSSLTFNSNNNNVAFTLLSSSNPNTTTIECAMACTLGYYPAAQAPPKGCTCPSAGCSSTSVNSQIKISNGNNLSTNMISYVQWALGRSPGGVYVQLPIFDLATCPAGNLSNAQTVIGYLELRITGATTSPDKSITTTIDCTRTTSSLPSQGFYGYRSTQVYLAK